MTIEQFLKEEQCFKHLKWVEVIQQENLAVNLDSMYIVEKDKVWCDVIFVDSNGNKRKVGGASYEQIVEKFTLLDASNLSLLNIQAWRDKLNIENPELTVINFEVNDDMHLIMQLQTNTNLTFEINNNGHLILTN